jgi:hypothetical protein
MVKLKSPAKIYLHLFYFEIILTLSSWILRSKDHQAFGIIDSSVEPYMGTNYYSDVVYLIQHYVIKLVSDLRQVGDFVWELRFPPIKLTATI